MILLLSVMSVLCQKLAWQLAGLAAIVAWTGVLSLFMFGLMRLMGILRVSEDMERKGNAIVVLSLGARS